MLGIFISKVRYMISYIYHSFYQHQMQHWLTLIKVTLAKVSASHNPQSDGLIHIDVKYAISWLSILPFWHHTLPGWLCQGNPQALWRLYSHTGDHQSMNNQPKYNKRGSHLTEGKTKENSLRFPHCQWAHIILHSTALRVITQCALTLHYVDL